MMAGSTLSGLDALFLEMKSVRTKDVIKDDQWSPVTVSTSDSLQEAFRVLTEEDVLSVPVVGRFGQYVGFLETQDLISFVIDLIEPTQSTPSFYSRDWFRASKRFRDATVGDLKHKQIRREAHPNYSLYHAFENLARFGDHRIAMLSPTHKVLGVVTQKLILDWIASNISILKETRNTPIYQVRPFTSVASVKQNEPAINAFRKMIKMDVGGMAVVDDANRLVDVLSERDLRGLQPGNERFQHLFKSVTSFKEDVRREYICPTDPKYLLPTDTFGDLIEMLSENDIHRVFICDSHVNRKLMDVISLSDVLEFLLRESSVPSTLNRA